MKKCRKCGERKAVFLFFIHNKTKDGLSSWCKRCSTTRAKERAEIASGWVFPYKGLDDPKYINDKAKTFSDIAKRNRIEMGLNW